MTRRDRLVIVIVAVVAAIAASWVLVVSPKRDQAAKLGTKVASEQQALDTARDPARSERRRQQAVREQLRGAGAARRGRPRERRHPVADHPASERRRRRARRLPEPAERLERGRHDGGRPRRRRRAPPRPVRPMPRAEQLSFTLQRQLLPALELLQQGPALRDARRQRRPGPRAPDLAQQRQPDAGGERLPADHRTDHRDHLHRVGSRRGSRRSDRRLFGGVVHASTSGSSSSTPAPTAAISSPVR